jgi:hypothetical protein
MPRIVYIQSDEGGQPYSPNGVAAARGFQFLGYDVRYFLPEELPELPLTPETPVVGGMGTTRAAIEQVAGHLPSLVGFPAALVPYLGRECWRTTPGEVREAGRYPVFLKPYQDAKFFTGKVFGSSAELTALMEPRPNRPAMTEDFPLLAQEPLAFLSEWRFFILRGSVLGASHYAGDALLFPAAGVVRLALGAFRGAPAGYSADFGVTDDGRTLLVEINDGYSLGSGGLVANLYAELLEARWNEMMP